MAEPVLPRATSRPKLRSKKGSGAVRRKHEQVALAALVLTRGSGMVVEDRHESYWAKQDRRSA